MQECSAKISSGKAVLGGDGGSALTLPDRCRGIVVFAHSNGSNGSNGSSGTVPGTGTSHAFIRTWA